MGMLDGKVAAVTGGASGIGEATVRRFVAEGASVAFCDRDGERGQRVVAELETAGAKVAFTHADVSTEAACLDFVNGAAQKFGRLDILINNAGIRKYEKVEEASAASWNEILNVNLMSYVFCAKAAVPLMRGNKGGAIVNVASVRSVVAGGGNLQYDTTKGISPCRVSTSALSSPVSKWPRSICGSHRSMTCPNLTATPPMLYPNCRPARRSASKAMCGFSVAIAFCAAMPSIPRPAGR